MSSKKCECTYCNKAFSTKFNLNKHLKNVHEIIWNKEIKKEYTCSYCDRQYSKRKALIAHMKKKHAAILGDKYGDKYDRRNIKCCTCGEAGFFNLKALRQHLTNTHQINIDYCEKNFKTKEEFTSWKETEERNTKSQFIKRCGQKVHINGDIVQYFDCNRSGVYRESPVVKTNRQRSLKRMGSRKIQQNCTASLTLTINSKGYSVRYCSTHIGHELEIDHLSLPIRLSLLNGKLPRLPRIRRSKTQPPKASTNSCKTSLNNQTRKPLKVAATVVQCPVQSEDEDFFDMNQQFVLTSQDSPTFTSNINNTENVSSNDSLVTKAELLLLNLKSFSYDQDKRKNMANLLDKILVLSNNGTSTSNVLIITKATQKIKIIPPKNIQ